MEEDLLERITESIKANGFDNSQPIHIWKTKDGQLHGWINFHSCF